jgi:hypothetical protein
MEASWRRPCGLPITQVPVILIHDSIEASGDADERRLCMNAEETEMTKHEPSEELSLARKTARMGM